MFFYPIDLTNCLKQLSRSCATDSTSTPGDVFGVVGSLFGNSIKIQPKKNWNEKPIIWHMSIKQSGSGKTPMLDSLCDFIYKIQGIVQDIYEKKVEEDSKKPKKERKSIKDPKSYYMSNFTIEALYYYLSGNRGLLYVADEISSIITSQNQYRGGKGSDRENYSSL